MGASNSSSGANQVLLLGLEKTGKTTFLKQITETYTKEHKDVQLESTTGINFVSLEIHNTSYDFWDIGGDPISISFWPTLYRTIKVDRVLFFIDLSDQSTYSSSIRQLLKVINEEELKHASFFLIFNVTNDNEKPERNEINKKKKELYEEKLKTLPLMNYESRVNSEILDVAQTKYTDQFLKQCFKVV